MTEKEAIKNLQVYGQSVVYMIEYCENFEPKEDISGYLDKKETFDIAIKALEELQQYREIGSAEECREAREKQKPKKPVKRSFILPYEGINACPNCKEPINKKEHHCKCGQAIDWDTAKEPDTHTRTCEGCFGAAGNDCGRCKEG